MSSTRKVRDGDYKSQRRGDGSRNPRLENTCRRAKRAPAERNCSGGLPIITYDLRDAAWGGREGRRLRNSSALGIALGIVTEGPARNGAAAFSSRLGEMSSTPCSLMKNRRHAAGERKLRRNHPARYEIIAGGRNRHDVVSARLQMREGEIVDEAKNGTRRQRCRASSRACGIAQHHHRHGGMKQAGMLARRLAEISIAGRREWLRPCLRSIMPEPMLDIAASRHLALPTWRASIARDNGGGGGINRGSAYGDLRRRHGLP